MRDKIQMSHNIACTIEYEYIIAAAKTHKLLVLYVIDTRMKASHVQIIFCMVYRNLQRLLFGQIGNSVRLQTLTVEYHILQS